MDTVYSKQELRESFKNVLAKRFSEPEELNSSAVSTLYEKFTTKLCNTRIQEFLDSFKHAMARKQGEASVSGQNLRDKLLTHHTNLKSTNATATVHEI